MGKFDGKYIRGLVGNIVQRKTKDGLVIQMTPKSVRQSKDTKKAQKVFGQGSVLACAIREDLLQVIRRNYDGDMVNRFNTPVRDVLKQCVNKETGQYTFQKNSFERLEGFEFNLKSLLINNLLVKPLLSFEGSILKISLPEIQVSQELKFPGQTNFCTLTVSVSLTALHDGTSKELDPQSVDIYSNQATVPQQDFEFEVAEGGCLCVAGIGLNYYVLKDQIQMVYNSKDFNPANVCGAVITPGIFVEPPPRVVGNVTLGSLWRRVDKLKLPAMDDSSAEE
jgi:hypothetical protein